MKKRHKEEIQETEKRYKQQKKTEKNGWKEERWIKGDTGYLLQIFLHIFLIHFPFGWKSFNPMAKKFKGMIPTSILQNFP